MNTSTDTDYKIINEIITYVQDQISRKLSRKELQKLIVQYRSGDLTPIYNRITSNKLDLHEQQVTEIYANYDQNITQLATTDQNDTSEQAGPTDTSAISIQSILGIESLFDLQMTLNPSSLYEHIYVGLDTNYRDTTGDSGSTINKFTWKYAPTQNLSTGYCNSVGVVRNIVGMRMYQPKIGFLADMDTDAKRVSILVEELQSQAYIAENGRRFHFLLRPVYVALQTMIELSTEDYNDGIFNFRKPIKHIDSLTISFGNPLNILNFPIPLADRFIVVFEFTCLKS